MKNLVLDVLRKFVGATVHRAKSSLARRVQGALEVQAEPTAPLFERPLQLHFSYFPGITKEEAREYARRFAARNHRLAGASWFGAERFLEGYAFEVHEGGPGKALLPGILAYYDKNGSRATADEPIEITFNTMERTIQVEVHPGGLQSYLLPGGQHEAPTPGIFSSRSLELLDEDLSPVLLKASKVIAGAGLAVLGVAVLLFLPSIFGGTEFQTAVKDLPISQAHLIAQPPAYGYVHTLKYARGHWQAEISKLPAASGKEPGR